METSRVEGLGHQVKGAMKQTLGKMIGDAKLASDGAAERAVGDAQNVPAPPGGQLIAGIDTARITGVGHQLSGAIKLGLGKLIGDAKMALDGSAERDAGKAQNAAGSARDEAREASADTLLGEHAKRELEPPHDGPND